jgi:NTP pyrophosphatase (non-canonical NTP hydrolase)
MIKGKKMRHPVDLHSYRDYVLDVTSEPSLSNEAFKDRLTELEWDSTDWVNWPELITAAIGIQAETGEFSEVVKKCIFQGKEMNETARFHAMRELGDVIWYWIHAVNALGYEPDEVIKENIRKLESRYPGGFDVERSEVRKEGDI